MNGSMWFSRTFMYLSLFFMVFFRRKYKPPPAMLLLQHPETITLAECFTIGIV
jgi:hypothetical protein